MPVKVVRQWLTNLELKSGSRGNDILQSALQVHDFVFEDG